MIFWGRFKSQRLIVCVGSASVIKGTTKNNNFAANRSSLDLRMVVTECLICVKIRHGNVNLSLAKFQLIAQFVSDKVRLRSIIQQNFTFDRLSTII